MIYGFNHRASGGSGIFEEFSLVWQHLIFKNKMGWVGEHSLLLLVQMIYLMNHPVIFPYTFLLWIKKYLTNAKTTF